MKEQVEAIKVAFQKIDEELDLQEEGNQINIANDQIIEV